MKPEPKIDYRALFAEDLWYLFDQMTTEDRVEFASSIFEQYNQGGKFEEIGSNVTDVFDQLIDRMIARLG